MERTTLRPQERVEEDRALVAMMTTPTVPSTADPIRLVDCEGHHLPIVRSLNEAAVPAVNSVSVEFFERCLPGSRTSRSTKSPQPYFRVAVRGPSAGSEPDETRVVGFLLALWPGEDYDSPNYQWFSELFLHFLYVDRIVVAEAGQRRGLGTQFYDDLVAFGLGSRGGSTPPVDRICCEVNLVPRNDQSLEFHYRYGFRQRATQDTDGGAKTVSLMTLELGGDAPKPSLHPGLETP